MACRADPRAAAIVTGMDELVAYIRRALDEDERSIRTWAACCFHIEACDETGGYLERFDEDRMLADIAAKRRILDLWSNDAKYPDWDAGYEGAMDDVVKLLAQPYAGGEGWRPELAMDN